MDFADWLWNGKAITPVPLKLIAFHNQDLRSQRNGLDEDVYAIPF